MATDPNSTSATDKAISSAQTRLQADRNDDNARLDLARAFLQKAREVADPSFYVKAEGLLDGVLKRQPKNFDALVAMGTLQLAQHRFDDAIDTAKKAVQINPDHQPSYAVLADGYTEMGRSNEALTAIQKMLDLKPDLPALSRASYARELRGDLDGAISAMNQAIQAGGSAGGENLAYVQSLLGGLLLTNGDISGAEAAYAASLKSFPNFGAAQAGQARVLMARQRFSEAADVLAPLVTRQPLPEYAVAQGDALFAADKIDEANEAYALVDVTTKLYAANGVNVDRETALFEADHRNPSNAVKQARKALESHASLSGRDVLAWALFKDGKVGDAAKESDRALSEGSRDPQQRFHAAAIAAAQGNSDKARANLQMVLNTNPYFSGFLLPQVRELAGRLGLPLP